MLQEPVVTSPAPTFPTSLRYLQNGDALNTTNHQLQAKDVADAVGHLKGTKADAASPTITGSMVVNGTADFNGAVTVDDLTMTNGNIVKLSSRSIVRVQHDVFHSKDLTIWDVDDEGSAVQLADSAILATYPLRIPHGVAVLNSVTVRLKGAGGHGGLPGTMPHIGVAYMPANGTSVSIGTADDASADTTAYQLAHTISVTGIGHTIDRTARRYMVQLRGEQGANFLAGLRAWNVECTYTCTGYDED